MGLTVSSAIWQQFTDEHIENITKQKRGQVIMDDAMILPIYNQHFEDLGNPFKILVKFGLKISPKILIL